MNEFQELDPVDVQARLLLQKEREATTRAEAALNSVRTLAPLLNQDGAAGVGLKYPWPRDVPCWVVIHGSRVTARESKVALVSNVFTITRMNADRTEAVKISIVNGVNFVPAQWFDGTFEDGSQERPLRAFEKEGGLLLIPPGGEVTADMLHKDTLAGLIEGALWLCPKDGNVAGLEMSMLECARNARLLRFVATLLPVSDNRRAKLNRFAVGYENAAADAA